jgi:hypothetical protein
VLGALEEGLHLHGETHVAGDVIRTAGGLAVTVRYGANAGQTIRGSDADFDAISARLVSPSGLSVNINGNADSDVGPFTLAEGGVYNLVLNGNGATTGDYRFRLIDVDQPPAQPLTLDTTVGIGLVFVPASALNLTGSYVNNSLRDYAVKDDWRTSQTIAGTRADTNINFAADGWGQRAAVGIGPSPVDATRELHARGRVGARVA